MTVDSPCIDICALDHRGMCRGCFRTSKEIGDWPYMGDADKREVLEDIKKRKASEPPPLTFDS